MFCHGGTIVIGSSAHTKLQTAMAPAAARQLSETHAFHRAGYAVLLRGDALASAERCRLVSTACCLHAREPDADCNTMLLQRKRVVLHAVQQCGLLTE